MNGHSQRAGLWSVEGAGVLARRGGLVLLSSLADTGFLDRLLDLLTETADAGGDGLRFVQSVEEALQADGSWRAGHEAPQRPAVIAFGEAGAGLAVSVTGAAWVEITTIDRTQQVVAGQPSMLLRCLVGSQVMTVRGGLGGGHEDDVPTDPFSRLDSGVVRAGGFAYRAGDPVDQVAAAVVVEAAEPAEPAEQAAPAVAAAEPETSESGVVGAGTAERVAAMAGDAGQPFDSVLLLGEEELGTVAPRAPLPLAPDQRAASADLPPAPEIIGVYCKNGHFDDPRARFCAVCGIGMNQQTLVPRPGLRPPLGLLVLDGGAIFQLDTDYVLGREPTLDAAVAAGEARPLRVVDDSGTVSRVHAKIQLDGWQVLVADLGSANGTFIRPPDEADQWLTPRVPVALVPGSQVVMGAFGFRYESHRGR
jgi:FHA domain